MKSLPLGRVVWAFLAAPVSAAILFSATVIGLASINQPFSGAVGAGLLYGAIALLYFGVVPTLLIGLPLFLWLRRRLRARVTWAVAAGAVLGAAPYGVIMLLPLLLHSDTITDADASETLRFILPWVGLSALFGAFGGLVFWLVAAWRFVDPADATPSH